MKYLPYLVVLIALCLKIDQYFSLPFLLLFPPSTTLIGFFNLVLGKDGVLS